MDLFKVLVFLEFSEFLLEEYSLVFEVKQVRHVLDQPFHFIDKQSVLCLDQLVNYFLVFLAEEAELLNPGCHSDKLLEEHELLSMLLGE